MNAEVERSLPTVTFALSLAAAAAVMLVGLYALAAAVVGGMLGWSPGQGLQRANGLQPVSGFTADIPRRYLALYIAAAARYGLDWAILAAVGKLECDHGRAPDPSCTRRGAVNSAGAGGPAQFLASTWRAYGVDGDGDGVADRWDPADAIFSMAAYLRASGAPRDYRSALFAYNHSLRYVGQVERWAAAYRAGAAMAALQSPAGSPGAATPALQMAGSSVFTAGSQAVLSPSDGHLALVPLQAPPVVQAMVTAGNELQDLPYGPGGHPDPRGAESEDCSSAVNYVLYRSGVRPIGEIVRENPLAQDYTRWGDAGTGRWVSIYATTSPTDHVFVVIAGLRLDTSHRGTDVGPNRLQDGPRWRVFGRIPSWAHWTVRHPPGL